MTTRLTRAEQVGRNRDRVLEAARRVFLTRGYAGATLEAIADEAGFSKGVVYSQFDSKADLLLTLLDRRITERAADNSRVVEAGRGLEAVLDVLSEAVRQAAADDGWAGLVIEFRVLAARDPELGARYARAHARTVEGVAAGLRRAYAAAGVEPPDDPVSLAESVLALFTGAALERATNPAALPQAGLARIAARVLGVGADTLAQPDRSGRG